MLKELFNRRLDKYFEQHYKDLQKSQKKMPFRDLTYYYHQHLLEDTAYFFNIVHKSRHIKSNIEEAVNQLDYYYLISKLRYACAILNREQLLAVKYKSHLLEEILAYLELHPFQEIPIIRIYHRLFWLFKEEEDENHYQDLKQLLLAHSTLLPKNELRQIYTATFNYCNKLLKNGRPEYLREIFDIFGVVIKENIFISEDGFITPPQFYRNAVMAALRLGEIDWAETFIYNYKNKLRPDYRANTFSYCLAALHFYKQEYPKTLDYLLSFEFQDSYHYIEHKTLLVKTYYELAEWETLSALLLTFKTYLRRSKVIPKHYKTPYKNFIDYTNKLLKIKITPSFKKTMNNSRLESLLSATSLIAEREWLLGKVGD